MTYVVRPPETDSMDDTASPPNDGWADATPVDPREPPESGGQGKPEAPISWSTVAERLSSVRALGPRHPTGIDPLDLMLRGGLRAEKIMVLGGAPGAGKTTLGVQIAEHWARAGVAVGWLAIDEEPAGIDARRLQSLGVSRELAEEPDAETVARAAELDALPFHVFDELTLEQVFLALADRYPDQPRAVVVDSLQTARTRQSDDIDSIRERITDVVATAKRYARQPATRATVVFTSELSRGAYRSKQSAEQIEDLAAFKESGAIEYQGHALLVLRTAKGDAALTHVSVPKNRIGTKGTFGLRLDFETATFTPEEISDGDSIEAMAAFDTVCDRVLEVVRANPNSSGRRVRTEAGMKRDTVYAAIERLEANGVIRNTGKGRAAQWTAIAKHEEHRSDLD